MPNTCSLVPGESLVAIVTGPGKLTIIWQAGRRWAGEGWAEGGIREMMVGEGGLTGGIGRGAGVTVASKHA